MPEAKLKLRPAAGRAKQVKLKGIDERLELDGLTLRLHALGLEAEDVDGEVTRDPGPERQAELDELELEPKDQAVLNQVVGGDHLVAGDRLHVGPEDGGVSTELEVVSVDLDHDLALRRDALRTPVSFKTGRLSSEPAVLEAAGGELAMIGKQGELFRAPLGSVEAKFPGWRSGVVQIDAGGESYKVTLGGSNANEFNLQASEDVSGDTEDVLEIAFGALNVIARRGARKGWKAVLEGERTPEEVASEWYEEAAA